VTADRTRKTSAKKATPGKTATAKKTSSTGTASEKPGENTTGTKQSSAKRAPRQRATAPRAESKPRSSATDVAKRAVDQLAALTGKSAEGVTGIERTDDGWQVTAEVLELRRIPETTDVLARYEIDTDEKGDLTGYRRAGRYTRGSARED
jgi:hypothetical protein